MEMIGTKQFEEVLYGPWLAAVQLYICATIFGTASMTCYPGKYVIISCTFELMCAITSYHYCPLSKAFLIIVTLCGEDLNVERLDPARGSGLSPVARRWSLGRCCCSGGREKSRTKFDCADVGLAELATDLTPGARA